MHRQGAVFVDSLQDYHQLLELLLLLQLLLLMLAISLQVPFGKAFHALA
tara:strand:- start:314 stop:460 length:147 start_codon:yes stop_codon:yes gene_type:complete